MSSFFNHTKLIRSAISLGVGLLMSLKAAGSSDTMQLGYHHTTWCDSKSKVIIAILTNATFETTNSEPDQAANARQEQVSAGLIPAIAALDG